MAWMLGARETPERAVERFHRETRIRIEAAQLVIQSSLGGTGSGHAHKEAYHTNVSADATADAKRAYASMTNDYRPTICRLAAKQVIEAKRVADVAKKHKAALTELSISLHAILGTASITGHYEATDSLAPALDALDQLPGLTKYAASVRSSLTAMRVIRDPASK